MADWFATDPGKHGKARADPTEHEVPAGHTMHWLILVITLREVFLRVPPGQGSGVAEPSAQK